MSAALVAALALLPACGGPRDPAVVLPGSIAPVTASNSPVRRLQTDLTRLFGDPAAGLTLWAVAIQSMDRGDALFRLNDTIPVMPASTLKIATLATAAERLGWDYRYETQLVTHAPIESGVLKGDLIVRGSGDPTISSRFWPSRSAFDEWAHMLRAGGITKIEGRIIGDDNAFEDEGLGAGWSWDDLVFGYAAPGSALQRHENVADFTIRPGLTPGEPALIELQPPHSGISVTNQVVTAPTGTQIMLGYHRLPGQSVLTVTGLIPAGAQPVARTVAVDNPTDFFVRGFRDALVSGGIDVAGEAIDIDTLDLTPRRGSAASSGSAKRASAAPPIDAPQSHHEAALTTLIVHRSPPLSEIAGVMMKFSQNLYAETLLRSLGGNGTAGGGRRVLRSVLDSWDIDPEEATIVDGSGLSRYNYVTASALVRILHRMRRDERRAAPFMASLPVAGRDGTLASRFKGTRAEQNVRAKTGTMANVRALAGYVTTLDGELLGFAVIANNSPTSAGVDDLIDRAVERLANFTRR